MDVPSSGSILACTALGPRAAPPVVLLHGLGGQKEAWFPVQQALAARRRVLAFDHRGAGTSPAPDPGATLADFAADLWASLDREGQGRTALVGHSFGGGVALEAALAAPARVTALVLVSTAGAGRPRLTGDPDAHEALRRAASLTAAEWRSRVIPHLFGPAWRDRHAARLDRVARFWAATPRDPEGIARQWQAWEAWDRWDDLPRLALPVLVVHGTADTLASPENGHRYAARIPGARLVLLPGVGHYPQVEDPAGLLTVIAPFLDEADPVSETVP